MGSKTPKNTTSTTTTTIPANVSANYDYVSDAAKYFAAKPNQQYAGEGVAPLNSVQNAGVAGIQAANGSGQPYTQQAENYVGQGAAPVTEANMGPLLQDYTNNVVDATRANLNANDAIQQQGVLGTAIKGGYFGGDRAGVAAADLARQQGLSDNATIANLYNTSYQTALGQANANSNRNLQAAQTEGSLGTQAFNQAEQGAAATLGAGNTVQANQQAQDTYAKSLFDQNQQYPFQTTSWLSGILTGMGNQGSTSSTTAPGASTTSQVAGAATAGVGILGATGAFGSTGWLSTLFASDERVKENIHPVGQTFDGQPIYRFNYLDDPRTQIGLIAQDVAQTHPSAVGEMGGGVLGVDYDRATRGAAQRGHFADGGDTAGVAGISLQGTPISGWGQETFPGQDELQGKVTHRDTAGDNVVAGYTIPHTGAAPAAPAAPSTSTGSGSGSSGDSTVNLFNSNHDTGNGGGLGGASGWGSEAGFSQGDRGSIGSFGGGSTNWGGIIGGGLGAIGGGLLGGVGGAIAGGVGGYNLGTSMADARQDAEQDRNDDRAQADREDPGGGSGWKRGGRIDRGGLALGGVSGDDDDEEEDTPTAPPLPGAPPALGTAPQTLPAPGVAGSAGTGFKAPPGYYSRSATAESSGDPTAKAKTSSAYGLYGFTDGTWSDTIKRHPELGVDVSRDRSNPDAQRKVMEAFTADNAGLLEARGISPTAANLRSQHVLGSSGGVRFIQGYQNDPDAPATKYAAPDQVAANKTMFFNKDGSPKTVAQVYSNFAGQGGGEADLPAEGAHETSGVAGQPSKLNSGLSDQDKWMALTMAGLGIMGGTSQYAAANIGQGAQKGIEYLQAAKQNNLSESRAQLEAKRLDEELAQHKVANDQATKRLAISQQQADQTGGYYDALKKKYDQDVNDPSGTKRALKDPAAVATGKVYADDHNTSLGLKEGDPGFWGPVDGIRAAQEEQKWTVVNRQNQQLAAQNARARQAAAERNPETGKAYSFPELLAQEEERYGVQHQNPYTPNRTAPASGFRTDLPVPPSMQQPGGGVAGAPGAPAAPVQPGAGVAPAGRPVPRVIPGPTPAPAPAPAGAPGGKAFQPPVPGSFPDRIQKWWEGKPDTIGPAPGGVPGAPQKWSPPPGAQPSMKRPGLWRLSDGSIVDSNGQPVR